MRLTYSKSSCLTTIAALAAASIILTGCGGSQKLLAIKTFKKVAIVEISADKTIEFDSKEEENSTGAGIQSTVKFVGALTQGKSLSEAADQAKHSAVNVLNLSAGTIYKTIVESNNLAIESEDFVKSNSYFQGLVSDKNVADFEIPAEGYKLLKDDEAKYAELCKSLGVDAIITVKISFQKTLFTGANASGQAKGRAIVYVKLYDINGNEIWGDRDSQLSDESTGMLNGAYKFETMEELCSEAAVTATKNCMERLKKDIAELDKK